MLFEEHKKKIIRNDNEVLYYAGGTVVRPSVICYVLGIKQGDGNIRTTVTYHYPDQMPELKSEKIYSRSQFEKFLYEIDQRMINRYGDSFQLKEFGYRTRTFDTASTVHLDEEELEFLHYKYLFEMVSGSTRSDAYEHITELLKYKIKERI